MSNETAKRRNEDPATITRPPRRVRGPRWVLVRQGEGPNRKWVWQMAGTAGSGHQDSSRP